MPYNRLPVIRTEVKTMTSMPVISNYHRIFSSGPITIITGEDADEEKFFVHEPHICSTSSFFYRAMSRDWKERVTRSIHLLEEDDRAFEIYI